MPTRVTASAAAQARAKEDPAVKEKLEAFTVRLFTRMVELDPENVASRIKLAELSAEAERLRHLWQTIEAMAGDARAPARLHGKTEPVQWLLGEHLGDGHLFDARASGAGADRPMPQQRMPADGDAGLLRVHVHLAHTLRDRLR